MLGAFALGAALLFVTAPKAHADNDARNKCQQRVERAHDHYRREVQGHGRNSSQAQEAREKLQETWQRCYTEANGWYDPGRHEWRTDRDWDQYNWDNDRDRDRDHDRDRDRDRDRDHDHDYNH
jgi:hypothetical protein